MGSIDQKDTSNQGEIVTQKINKSWDIVVWKKTQVAEIFRNWGNMINYNFHFESVASNIPNDLQEEIINTLWENAVKCRIYFIRHGMTQEEFEYQKLSEEGREQKYLSQDDSAVLCNDARQQYEEIWQFLWKSGLSGENTYIFCCAETDGIEITRIKESEEILARTIGVPNNRRIWDVIGLDTTDKKDKIIPRRTTRTEALTIDFSSQLKTYLSRKEIEGINVICIIHKSNIDGVRKGFFWNDIETHLPSTPKDITTWQVNIVDINLAGDVINYANSGSPYISLDTKDARQFYEEMEKHLEVKWLQLWETQNRIQASLYLSPTLCIEYLYFILNSSKDSFYDRTKRICVLILLDHKLLIDVKKYIRALYKKDGNISFNLLKTLFSHPSSWDILKESILLNLQNNPNCASTIKFCEKYLPSLLSSYQPLSQTLSVSITRATNIFQYSLDTQIQKDKSNLIERKFYSYRKKTNKEIQALEKMREREAMKWRSHKKPLSEEDYYTKESSTLNTILSSHFPSILLGYVGNGKSHELARMYQELLINPTYLDYIPLFYSAKDSKGDICSVIRQEIELIRFLLPNKKIVVFFDGLDELSGTLHQEVENLLKSLHKPKDAEKESLSVIIGSRPSGFNKYGDDSFLAIHFDNLSSEERDRFLLSRLRKPDTIGNSTISEEEIQKRLKEIQDFLKNGMLEEDLKNTPLILFFLTRLVDTESKEDSEWKKLSNIRNRAELYEQITRRILIDHQGNANTKNVKLDDGYIGLFFDTLGYCAFLKHEARIRGASSSQWTSEPPVTREIILKYLKQRNEWLTEVSRNRICDQIFILYHQKERGGYEFILKSFEEFFLARYLAYSDCIPKSKNLRQFSDGSDIIYEMRNLCQKGNDGKWLNWGDWREFKPVVMFYGQLLGNRINEEILNAKYDGDEEIIWNLTPEQRVECIKNATEQDSESLARLLSFLGEEGILKNDDIFGENFFMWVAIFFSCTNRHWNWAIPLILADIAFVLNSKWKENNKTAQFLYLEAFTNKKITRFNINKPIPRATEEYNSSKELLEFLLLLRGNQYNASLYERWLWEEFDIDDDVFVQKNELTWFIETWRNIISKSVNTKNYYLIQKICNGGMSKYWKRVGDFVLEQIALLFQNWQLFYGLSLLHSVSLLPTTEFNEKISSLLVKALHSFSIEQLQNHVSELRHFSERWWKDVDVLLQQYPKQTRMAVKRPSIPQCNQTPLQKYIELINEDKLEQAFNLIEKKVIITNNEWGNEIVFLLFNKYLWRYNHRGLVDFIIVLCRRNILNIWTTKTLQLLLFNNKVLSAYQIFGILRRINRQSNIISRDAMFEYISELMKSGESRILSELVIDLVEQDKIYWIAEKAIEVWNFLSEKKNYTLANNVYLSLLSHKKLVESAIKGIFSLIHNELYQKKYIEVATLVMALLRENNTLKVTKKSEEVWDLFLKNWYYALAGEIYTALLPISENALVKLRGCIKELINQKQYKTAKQYLLVLPESLLVSEENKLQLKLVSEWLVLQKHFEDAIKIFLLLVKHWDIKFESDLWVCFEILIKSWNINFVTWLLLENWASFSKETRAHIILLICDNAGIARNSAMNLLATMQTLVSQQRWDLLKEFEPILSKIESIGTHTDLLISFYEHLYEYNVYTGS